MVLRSAYVDDAVKMATSYIVKFFSNGWGSTEVLRQLAEWQNVVLDRRKMMQSINKTLQNTEIKLSPGKKINSSYTLYKGEFISPLAKFIPKALPSESEKAVFELVLPNTWKSDKKPICLHLAGTGDHFFWRRRHFMASPLAKDYNIGSIILENPFYGHRKPKNQVRSSVNHVSDIFVMGAALLFESAALMFWCQRQGFGPLGITGISMGGHMATVAASGWLNGPIAIVPCLSWTSAGPAFTDGVLSQSVNWPVLERQLDKNPEYERVLRHDIHNLMQTHYTSPSTLVNESRPSSSSPSHDSKQENNISSNLVYSKVTSAFSDFDPSSYFDLRNKKVSLELDLWKYLETVPKQLYDSTYGRLNMDYLREFVVSKDSTGKPSPETVAYMTGIMDQATHLSHFNKPDRDSPVIYVVAEHDRYIPRQFYSVTPKDIYPQADIRTIDSGHVIACLNGQPHFRKAIKDAFEQLGCEFEEEK